MDPLIDWQARARSVPLPDKLLLNGDLVGPRAGVTLDNLSPIDSRPLGAIPRCDADDVDAAVKSARAAFDAGPWPRITPRERKRALLRLAALIERDAETLALLETLDTAKPIADTLSEMLSSAQLVAWYAETADKTYGQSAPLGERALGVIDRVPIGVVGAIVPWNFPLQMACTKVAPALSAGNVVILKPAEQSSLTALHLGALALEAELPPGVLQVLTGLGSEVGAALGLHDDVDAIGFTGSTAVGKAFMGYAAQSNMKRLNLECGGKNPSIVFPDVEDWDGMAATLAGAIFENQGQMCNASSKVIAHRSVIDRVADTLAREAREHQPEDPLDARSVTGGLINEAHKAHVAGHVDGAVADGAEVVTGGRIAEPVAGGSYYEPTVLRARADQPIARDEVFGPVVALVPFDTEDEAVALAHDGIYGLTASVWSGSASRAPRVARRLRAGTVWVNTYHLNDVSMPFGGFRQSGIGRDKSFHALASYTELRSLVIPL